MKRFPWVVLIFVGLLLLSVVFACRSSSSSQSEVSCAGEVIYEGKTFTGEGKNSEEAQQFACNKYCLEADPVFDAHYGIWLDSPQGKAAGRPPKKEAIYKDKELMNYLTNDCATTCVASVKDGKLKGSAICK